MILESETSLTPPQYAALLAAVDDPTIRLQLKQYTPEFSSHDSDGHATAIDCFDAIVCGTVVVRVYRPNVPANTLTVDTLADEAGGDESWASQNLVATNITGVVPPTLAVSGNTVRAFWYDNTTIKYFESVDNGASWGAAQTVGAVSGVTFLAATALTRCHYTTTTASNNTQFHVYIYSGAWAATDSILYWPFVPTSMDAIEGNQLDDGASATNDIIAISTDYPPIIATKVAGTEVYNELERVQGLAFFRYQNGKWSDHHTFDLVDRASSFPARYGVRLSKYGTLMFLCYERHDGTANYGHYGTAVTRSKTGLEWELPFLLTRNMNDPSILIKRGNHAYLINAWKTYRSMSCGYTGDAQITQDITANVTNLRVERADIASLQVTLGNPEQELDATTPLSTDAMLEAHLELGYSVGGTDLKIPVLIADVDAIGGDVRLPTDHISFDARDYLGRLLTIQADQPNEWESQVIAGDNFEAGADGTDYSGMRHTAVMDGSFKTPAGENLLALISNRAPGIAFNTFCADAMNGVAQSGVMVTTTEEDDYAGLCFRAYDKRNLMAVKYDPYADKIKLYDRKNSEDTVLATSSAMGWTDDTWYWLRVRFRYGYVWVYSSTDGITWTSQIATEILGMTSGSAWSWTNFTARLIPNTSGRMGYIGLGWSDYDSVDDIGGGDWYPPIPDPLPPVVDPEPDPETDIGRLDRTQYHFAAAGGVGVFYTNTLGDVSPVYIEMQNAELPLAGSKIVYDMKYYTWPSTGRESLFILTDCGVYEYAYLPAPGGHWTQVADVTALLWPNTMTVQTFDKLVMSTKNEGVGYISWHGHKTGAGCGLWACSRFGVSSTVDGWQNVSNSKLIFSQAANYSTARCGASSITMSHNGGGQTAYATCGRGQTNPFNSGVHYISKTIDGGASWATVYSYGSGIKYPRNSSIWLPYVSEAWTDDTIYAGTWNDVISSDAGATWPDASRAFDGSQRITGSSYDKNVMETFGYGQQVRKWSPSALTTWSVRGVQDFRPLERDTDHTLLEIIGVSTAGAPYIFLDDGVSTTSKDGNWWALTAAGCLHMAKGDTGPQG